MKMVNRILIPFSSADRSNKHGRKNSNAQTTAKRLAHRALPPKAKVNICTGQVFWLSRPPEAFPSIADSGYFSGNTDVAKDMPHRDHSYGDSAGFTPDFPFNRHAIIKNHAAEPNTARR